MKFLNEVIKKGDCFYVEKVIPSTGYCEIIEYITGKETEEHRMFTQITAKADWYQIDTNPFLTFLNFIDTLFPFKKLPKIKIAYSLILDKFLSYSNLPEEVINVRYNIPLNLLPRLQPIESKYEYDSLDFGGEENLFVWMKEHNISYDIDDFVNHNKVKGTDKERLDRLENKIVNKGLKEFTLIYIGYGELAHFWGTCSERFGEVLRSYSERIRDLNNLFCGTYDNSQFIILGDHGMVDVVSCLNIRSIINNILGERNLKYLKDYIYFIDSALIRVWLREKGLVQLIEEKLVQSLTDNIEYDQELRNYLDKFKPKFGDIILLLRAGYTFFPDFFNVLKNKGMHGYLNRYKEQAGTMISFGTDVKPVFKESIKLSEVKSYIQDLWMN